MLQASNIVTDHDSQILLSEVHYTIHPLTALQNFKVTCSEVWLSYSNATNPPIYPICLRMKPGHVAMVVALPREDCFCFYVGFPRGTAWIFPSLFRAGYCQVYSVSGSTAPELAFLLERGSDAAT